MGTIANGKGSAVLRFLPIACGGLAVGLASTTFVPVAQAAALRAAEQDTVNFAFATQLGSGVYDVSGRELQIYRLPFEWQLTSDTQPTVRLLLPVAFGFFDFEPGDLIDEGLPTGIDTLSFTPGVELGIGLGEDWSLEPAALIGRAWEQESDADALIETLRLRAVQETQQAWGPRRLQATLGYTRIEFEDLSGHGDVAFLELAGEGRRDIAWQPFGLDLDAGAYAVLLWFADRPDAPVARTTEENGFAAVQFEAGFTLGVRGDREIWGMPLPRLGVGYRVGDGLAAWRIVIGDAF